jgi:hypothetical protein
MDVFTVPFAVEHSSFVVPVVQMPPHLYGCCVHIVLVAFVPKVENPCALRVVVPQDHGVFFVLRPALVERHDGIIFLA